MLSELHFKSVNLLLSLSRRSFSPPQKGWRRTRSIIMFLYSFIQPVVGTIANAKAQPSLGLITQAATLNWMTNLSKPAKTQNHILGQLFSVFHLWKGETVGLYCFLINLVNTFMLDNLSYHFLVSISISFPIHCNFWDSPLFILWIFCVTC